MHGETYFPYDYFMNNNALSSQRYVILRLYVMLLSQIPSGTQRQRLEPIAWSDVRDTNQIRGLAYRLSYHHHAWRGDRLFKEERGATKRVWAEIKLLCESDREEVNTWTARST